MSEEKEIKIKCKRCSHPECRKKLTIIDLSMSCKCNLCFCNKHRPPDAHNCCFDYSDKKDLVKKYDDMKCIADKLVQV